MHYSSLHKFSHKLKNPEGKSLVENLENDFLTDNCGSTTEAQLRDCLAGFMAVTHDYSIQVDGAAVGNLKSFRIGAGNPAFCITLPPQNLYRYFGYKAAPGTYCPAVSDGVYLMLAPMSSGRHVIHFNGSFGDYFSFDITYILSIR